MPWDPDCSEGIESSHSPFFSRFWELSRLTSCEKKAMPRGCVRALDDGVRR